jgi:hypothetical protein
MASAFKAFMGSSVPVLEGGGSPGNGAECNQWLHTATSSLDLPFFLYVEFNEETLEHVSPEMLWLEQQALRAATKISPASAPSSSSSSTSSSSTTPTKTPITTPTASPRATTVKLEAGVHAPVANNYLLSATSDTASLHLVDPRFLDPITRKPETSERHSLRYAIWSFIEKMLKWYPHLLRKRGNLARIPQEIMAMSGQCTGDVFCDNVIKMSVLSKTPSLSFSDFSQQISDVRSAFEHLNDPELRLGDKIVRLFVLRALTKDPRYNVSLNFLRRQPGSLDDTLLQLTADASNIESSSSQIVANQATARQDNPRKNRKTKPCFSWRDKGSCRNGARCAFNHGDVTPADVTAPTGGARAAGRTSTGKCLECGGAHSVDACSIFKIRHAKMKAAKSAMAAQLLVDQRAQEKAASLVASHAAVGYDPVIMAALNAEAFPGAEAKYDEGSGTD